MKILSETIVLQWTEGRKIFGYYTVMKYFGFIDVFCNPTKKYSAVIVHKTLYKFKDLEKACTFFARAADLDECTYTLHGT